MDVTNGPPWLTSDRVTMEAAPARHGSSGANRWSGPIDTSAASNGSPRVDAEESAIVRAVVEGDQDAFRVLVERNAAAVVRACSRVLGDLGEAEDVAQEAFVIAYRSIGTWRADGPFGAWLARIAVRLAIRQAARRRAVAWVSPVAGAGERVDDAVAGLPAGTDSDPEGVALRGERQRLIRHAVAVLDEPYREVVALRFFAERSLDEIATLTGRPLGTVKTHLYRGLLRLRSALDEGQR